MTAEPRPVEAIRADLARLGELDAAFRERVELARQGVRLRGGLSDPADSSERNSITQRLVADVEPLLARLAAADRENAELRGEVERLRKKHAERIAVYVPLVDAAEREAESNGAALVRIAAERDDLRAQLAAAQAQLAEAQEAIDQSAEVMSSLGGALVAAEARLEAVRSYLAMARATESTDHAAGWNLALTAVKNRLAALSAAPQPEPTHFEITVEGNGALSTRPAFQPEPPASDKPARQSPEPDSRRWGGSLRHMPDPYRADHNCVPEGCSECRPECRHCNGSGNAHTFDGDDVGICGTCHGTGSAAGGGL